MESFAEIFPAPDGPTAPSDATVPLSFISVDNVVITCLLFVLIATSITVPYSEANIIPLLEYFPNLMSTLFICKECT